MDNRAVRAVADNDVIALQGLGDATDWCNYIEPQSGNTLLHIAVLNHYEEVFRYLLSLGKIDLNHKNNNGESLLQICLFGEWCCVYDVFACELIKMGASFDTLFFPSDSDDEMYRFELGRGNRDGEMCVLHFVIGKSFVGVSKLLMEMGYDLNARNARGQTPMFVCLEGFIHHSAETEIATALLCFGADPWQGQSSLGHNSFEQAMKSSSHTVREAFFYFMIDEYTLMDVHLQILVFLAHDRSPFFLDTIKHVRDVIVDEDTVDRYHFIFRIDNSHLAVLIQKFPDAIREVFFKTLQTFPNVKNYKLCNVSAGYKKMSLESANLLVESDDLRDSSIALFSNFNHDCDFYALIGFGLDESIVIENVCFLLSYGLTLKESNLRTFYERYGFGQLLKILLYMDIARTEYGPHIMHSLLLLLFDVRWDLQKILENLDTLEKVETLLPYFAHPEIRALCSNEERPEVAAAIARQPDVPLLLELARNVFRGHMVKTFEINNAPQFYTLVDKLPISQAYKQIITLERKLY